MCVCVWGRGGGAEVPPAPPRALCVLLANNVARGGGRTVASVYMGLNRSVLDFFVHFPGVIPSDGDSSPKMKPLTDSWDIFLVCKIWIKFGIYFIGFYFQRPPPPPPHPPPPPRHAPVGHDALRAHSLPTVSSTAVLLVPAPCQCEKISSESAKYLFILTLTPNSFAGLRCFPLVIRLLYGRKDC